MPFFRGTTVNQGFLRVSHLDHLKQEKDSLRHKIKALHGTLGDSKEVEEMLKDFDKQTKAASKLNRSLKKDLEKLSKQLQIQMDVKIKCKRSKDNIEKLNHMNGILQRQMSCLIKQLSDPKTLENEVKALEAQEKLLRKKKFQLEKDLRRLGPSQHHGFEKIEEKEVVVRQLEQETEALKQELKQMRVSDQKKENVRKHLQALRDKENSLLNLGSKLTTDMNKLKEENKKHELMIEELEAEQKTLEEKTRQLKKLEKDHEEVGENADAYKRQISQMKEHNLALSKQVHQFQTAEAELVALREEKKLLKDNRLRLEQEIQTFKRENAGQMRSMHVERDCLESKVQKERQSIQQTQQEVCALQQELQVMRDALQHKEDLKEELSKLKTQKQTAQNSSFKLKRELQELQNVGGSCKVLKHELEVEQKILEIESQKLKTLEKQHKAVTRDVETVKQDLELLRRKNQALSQEVHSLERVVKNKAEEKAELDGLRKERLRLQNSIQRLKEEIQRKKAEFQHHSDHVLHLMSEGTVNPSDPQSLKRAVDQEQVAVELFKLEATNLTNQLQELEAALTQQESLRIELDGVLAQKKLVEENNSRLKTKVQKLQEEQEAMMGIQEELVAQNKALAASNLNEKELEEAHKRIKADIVALHFSNCQLADEKQALSEKRKDLTKMLEAEAELCALRTVSCSLKDDIEKMKQEIERQRAEFVCIGESSSDPNQMPATVVSTLLRKVSEEKFAVGHLEQEANVLKRKLQDLQDSVQQKQSLEQELHHVSAEKKLVEDKISEMKREIPNLQNTLDQYSKIDAEISSESKTLETLHQHERELEKKYGIIQTEISALQAINSKLAAEKQALSEKLQQQEQEYLKKKAEAEEELRALRKVTSSLKDGIETLKQKIQSQKETFGGVFCDGALSVHHEAVPDPSDALKDLLRRVADEKIGIENLKLEVDRLNSTSQKMQDLNQEKEVLEKQLCDLHQEKGVLQEMTSTTKRQIQKLQKKHKEYIRMNEEAAEKNNELRKLYTEQKRLEKECEAVKTEMNAVRAGTSKLREKNHILTHKHQSKQRRVLKMKEELANMGAATEREEKLLPSQSGKKGLPPPKKNPDPVSEGSSDDTLTNPELSDLPFDSPSLSDS